jgi:hypothetical protein
MGKVLFAVCAALAACILGLGLVAYLNRGEETAAVDNLLAEDLTRRIQTAEQRGEEVDLAAVTDFAWDRVLIVQPGTPPATISDTLGFEFNGALNYSAESNGLFVFVRARQVARYADYRGRGEFVGFRTPIDELDAEEAILDVRDLRITHR